jgi:hypothetical protein
MRNIAKQIKKINGCKWVHLNMKKGGTVGLFNLFLSTFLSLYMKKLKNENFSDYLIYIGKIRNIEKKV